MAKVIITRALKEEVLNKFKSEAGEVFALMKTLENHPLKGKALTHVAEIVIKELRYGKFRLYFITDGHILKFGTQDEFAALLIKFIRISEKKDQQKVIGEIKKVLVSLGFEKL